MSYLYIKKTIPLSTPRTGSHKKFAWVFFVFGAFVFTFAFYPILSYQIKYASSFNPIINPLSTRFYNQNDSILGSLDTDYTQISNWFVDQSSSKTEISDHHNSSYLLSIPKLKINQAIVSVGSMDLKKSLIQYPQTALPGQLGNTVIFGHSVLPQFFNPKSYLTIFSTLFKLETGDQIVLDFDNIQYRYLVEELFEVQPTNLSVLEQRFDGRYLTLITCSPPGTYLRRLIIKARIVEF